MNRYQTKQRRRQRWYKVVSALACVVVFCTTYALILPAITMENPRTVLSCPLVVHEHTADCYDAEGNIICGQADFVVHTHNENCYDSDGKLVCPLPEIEAHTHTDACYTEERTLLCGEAEDLGHVHTSDCYERVQGELLCTLEENDEHQHTDACYEWSEVLICTEEERAPGHVHTDACYEIHRTLNCGKEEILLHTHTDACYGDDGSLICGQLEVRAHTHGEECFLLLGRTYTYEDETVSVEVTLAAESTVPKGAVLSVQPITDTDETYDYEALVQQAEKAVAQTAAEIVLYDISFYTTDGEYLPVEDSAMVSIRFSERVLSEPAGEVAVLHYQEAAAPVALETVDVERDETDAVSALTFQTEGFSVFAVVTVTEGSYQRVTDVKDLDGKSVAVLSNSAKYAMMAAANSDGSGRLASAVNSTADLSGYTFWTFEKNTDDTYYISNDGNYLVMGAQTLNTTTTESEATAFTVTIDASGLAEISASVGETTYYINLFGGENNPGGFKSYTSSSGNLQQLYIKVDQAQEGTPRTDLGGKSFAIANLNNSSRRYAMTSTPNTDNNRLTAVPVSVFAFDMGDATTTYVTGNDLTTWTFEATGTSGVYYIKANDTGKYLNPAANNSLTTSDTPVAITVTTNSAYPGQVMLVANTYYAVNWFGNDSTLGDIFGSYYGARNGNDYQTLCEVAETGAGLFYNINVPSMTGKGQGWQTTPTIDSPFQEVTDETTTLYAQPSGFSADPGTAGIENLYRYDMASFNSEPMSTTPAWEMGLKNNWYGEERFDGWTYTADGVTYLFAPEAEITKNADGSLSVTASKQIVTGDDKTEAIAAIAETTVTLPAGTMLTGHWTEVSSPVLFFVNYKGTILDTEGDVSGRRSENFTDTVAVGHVFYGKLKVGEDQVFGSGANAQITGAISPKFSQEFDQYDPDTQIVIDFLRECTVPSDTGTNYETKLQISAPGVNSAAVAANTLKLLRETGRTIQIATGTADSGSPNPTIDNSLCDEDHYEIRWYVLKEQTDSWHVDGVLVAKTAEISIAKTFSGISTAQAQELLEGTGESDTDGKTTRTGNFYIDTDLGAGTVAQEYLDIDIDSVAGQYVYHGSDATAGLPNSYHWTFHAITDEEYTLTEENYELDGYDVSSIVVHYYNDRAGTAQIKHAETATTDDDELGIPVTGGITTSVSFNNFYTPAGTGAMAIVKRDSTTGATDTFGMLQGAEFTLYSDEKCTTVAEDASGQKLVVTSNANGTAYFSGMEPGTYYLQETKAPQGYERNESIWQIRVTKDEDEKVTVKLYQPLVAEDGTVTWPAENPTTLYDGGIQNSYTVPDVANSTTITVVKTFEDLPNEELMALLAKSKADQVDENGLPTGYYIQLQGDGDVEEGKTETILTLDQAQARQDNTYVWTIYDLTVVRSVTGDDGEPVMEEIPYTISEHNYMLPNYVDTVVTAKMTIPGENGYETEDVTEVKSPDDSGNVAGPYLYIARGETSADTVAYIEHVGFSATRSDIVRLNNRYTNTFDLKLRKVDSNTDEPLSGAEFKIYGPFEDIPPGTDTIPYTYTDEDGNEKTVYYLKTITSGTDGYAVLADLRLSQGVNTFVYILDESTAPNGYAAAPAQAVNVTVEGSVINTPTGSDYLTGVLQYSAPNTKEEDYVHARLDTPKIWSPYTPENATVTLELYRVAHTERNVALPDIADAEFVTSITLDGTADPEPKALSGDADIPSLNRVQVYESAPWVATWKNLYAASRDYSTNQTHYHYFVREITTVPGFTTSYSCLDKNGAEPQGAAQKLWVTIGDEEQTITGYLLADMDEAYTLEITNKEDYKLPESGGAGTFPYAIGGTLLMACSLLYGYLLRRKGERRSAR